MQFTIAKLIITEKIVLIKTEKNKKKGNYLTTWNFPLSTTLPVRSVNWKI